jgi:catechol 2,3-dioxygenase
MSDFALPSGVQPPGFRMPDETRIGTVRIQVADLERSLGFYQELLGFRVIERGETPPRAALGATGSDAILLEIVQKAGVRPIPRRGLLGIYHFAVLLPHRPALGSFLKHVAEMGVQVGASDHGISEATYLVDPDGITVEVYRDRARSEWPVRNGAIVAENLPLDFQGIIGEAHTAWSGLPAGTTIGHVHFYVGDLPQAEAFYHRALGFASMITSYPGALFVAAGGYHHHVGLNTWASGSPVATDADAGLLDWELLLPDAESVANAGASLRENGFPVEERGGELRSSDPWGITVRIRPG